MGFIIAAFSFERSELALGQDSALGRDFAFEGQESFLEGLQVMTDPDASNSSG